MSEYASIRRIMLPAFLLLVSTSCVLCEAAELEWGTEVSKYEVWNWLRAYGGTDKAAWNGLPAAARVKLLERAASECASMQRFTAALGAITDGDAILNLRDDDIKLAHVCGKDGGALAERLALLRARLKGIETRVRACELREKDKRWLEDGGIRFYPENALAACKRLKEIRKTETSGAVGKSAESSLKHAGRKWTSGELDRIFSNKSAADTASFAAPEEFAAGKATLETPSPAYHQRYKVSPQQDAKIAACKARGCDLIDLLSIVTPEKIKRRKPDYSDTPTNHSITEMEKDFESLLGRELTFSDLQSLRADDNSHPTGYESNTLAALEHKYFVDEQVSEHCAKYPGLKGACIAVIRGAMPATYEMAKRYIDIDLNIKAALEREKQAGRTTSEGLWARYAAARYYPQIAFSKLLVGGSKGETAGWYVPASSDNKLRGSKPSVQNIACALHIACGR